MKNYVKPSIELNKFDVEDIITVSGEVSTLDNMSKEAQTIYEAYVEQVETAGGTVNEATNLVEFQW